MLIKLGITAVVVVVLLMAFSGEINEYFPNTATSGIDSFRQDVESIAAQSLESTEQQVDSSSRQIQEQLSHAGATAVDGASSTIGYAEEQFDYTVDKIGENLADLTTSITNTEESASGT